MSVDMDFGDVIEARNSNGEGFARLLKSNGASQVALSLVSEPRLDKARMRATTLITTEGVDVVGDVLKSSGCVLDDYRNNPVVMWEHGLADITVPIGTSQDEDGTLLLKSTKHKGVDAIEATCIFSQTLREAAQIYELVAEGIIRSASVQALPLEKPTLVKRKSAKLGLDFPKWSLREWSWVAIGVNPDAVAKVLRSNRLAGAAIAEPLLKTLRAIAPEKEKGTPAGGWPTFDTLPGGSDADNNGADKTADFAEWPLGAQVLATCKSGLASVVQYGNEVLPTVEQPDVREYVDVVRTTVAGLIDELQAKLASIYPQVDTDSHDAESVALKSVLAARTEQLSWRGVAADIRGLTKSDNLTKSQREMLAACASRMLAAIPETVSKSAREEAAPTIDSDRLARVMTGLVSLTEKLKDAVPVGR